MIGRQPDEHTVPAAGVVPFATELARYFMDFLETDFHKARNPKRNIQNKNNANLQITINLNKYKKLPARAWKMITSGFATDLLDHVKKGEFTSPISKPLLDLVAGQIALIDDSDIQDLIGKFQAEIDIAIAKFPKDTPSAITLALDGVSRTIKSNFLSLFVERIREPFVRLQAGSVDSVFQIEDELNEILMRGFEDPVSSIINHITLKKEIDRDFIIAQSLDLSELKNKLSSYFNSFSSGDFFAELIDITTNKNLLENQEFYLNFCTISFGGSVYPLFYLPMQITKSKDGFSLSFDSSIYVNKKCVQFISQQYASLTERRGSLSAFVERIVYLADERKHFIGRVDAALKDLTNYFGLAPYIDIHNSDRQVSKNAQIEVSNSCYIGLFDKSDESLINDYEEILQKLNDGDSQIAESFHTLVEDFISKNPVTITSAVENEWEKTETADKLVCQSPVPLNEEQRQILNALNKSSCKYISVEGPPGTGKSHTITAIVCDAILNNKSVLVLSDKKEALDVVEDKITQTLNKVRQDSDFQNPILRLGKAGNTYSKILSQTSMERIKEHYKAVRSDYKNVELAINQNSGELRNNIESTISAYSDIEINSIIEFHKLEAYLMKVHDLPVDINLDQFTVDDLINVRSAMKLLSEKLGKKGNAIDVISKRIYGLNLNVENILNTFIFFEIAETLKSQHKREIGHAKTIRELNSTGLKALETYVAKISELKSGIFGALFKGKQVRALNDALSGIIAHSLHPLHSKIEELSAIVSMQNAALSLSKKFEIEQQFGYPGDFVAHIHELVTIDLSMPTLSEVASIRDAVSTIRRFSNDYPILSAKSEIQFDAIDSLISNKLIQISDSDFEKIIHYVDLKARLQELFKAIPNQIYASTSRRIEGLVTTQMTYKMDERVVDFYENYRNDAKSLASVISKKQKFDRTSFEKLKRSFPCILAGIRDFSEFIPLENEIFDLVIIDEASQVSIAQALPALLRGKKVVVLGDKKQFSNVKSAQARSDTNREYLNRLKDVFTTHISNENLMIERLGKFDIKTSVLEFADRISNYNIMLRKHFRGYKELISYSSKYHYNDGLQAIKIRSNPIDDVIKFSFVEHDGKLVTIANSNQLEIEAIISEVERISKNEPFLDVGIITPHTNQQKLLVDAFSRHPDFEHFQKIHHLKIMTFDTCQGEERDVILYSMVANSVSDKLWGIFIKDLAGVDLEEGGQIKAQRLNVGLSRAKERIHFFLSKPIEEFTGSIGEALRHYNKILNESKVLPTVEDTDARSPMEARVLHWIQETSFFKENKEHIELHAQFPVGAYLKQLNSRYEHPAYVADFLIIFSDDNSKKHKIIIEYDGFEFHFRDNELVNEFNYGSYYTENHLYREKVLESYGYRFVRLNRFNIGSDPMLVLNIKIEEIVKKKPQSWMN